MKIVFAPLAVQRLSEIQSYIAYDNASAAVRVIARIRQVIEMLADNPKLGRVWEDGPSRVMVVSGLPYRIHYRVFEETEVVEILTVAHTSQIPPSFQ